MHDTDEHYSDERQSHDMRMEYVRKIGQLDIFTTYNSAKLEQAPVMV